MKAVVFCPNWIGDVVMATPTLRAIRRLHPEARLVGLMRPYVAATLAGNPWLDETILCDPRAADPAQRPWEVMLRLRRERFDLGLLLTNSVRTALLAWAGGVKRRVGYAREGRGFLLNDRLAVQRGRRGFTPSPLIDYYLALAYHLGAPCESYQMELFTEPVDEAAADALWRKFGFSAADRVVALNPGAAFGPAKRWPSPSFAELARRLADQQFKILVLCGPNERGFAQFIADASARPRFVKSLAEEDVSLGLSKAIIRRTALLVTTDSGPRHFAAAFGKPVVSLFGPTHQDWTETYYAAETRLQKQLPCGPCQQRVCPLGHHRCMVELGSEEVLAASLRALGGFTFRPAIAG